jgi:hypothetical protein
MPFLHLTRDMFVSDRAGTMLQEEPLKDRCSRRQWMHQEYSSGIRDRDLKEQLCLRIKRTSSRIFRKALMLNIMKQRVKPSVKIQKMSDWTLWRGQPPQK